MDISMYLSKNKVCKTDYLTLVDNEEYANEVNKDFAKMLSASDTNYLNILISKDDILKMNVAKYVNMLDPLYPNIQLANKFCEAVALDVDGYDDDLRELWEIPEIRKFTKALNEKFHYWFYFLDKDTTSLMWVTLALYSRTKRKHGKVEMDNAAFNEFLFRQMVNLNEVCLCSNGSIEKLETLTNNVCKYYTNKLDELTRVNRWRAAHQ